MPTYATEATIPIGPVTQLVFVQPSRNPTMESRQEQLFDEKRQRIPFSAPGDSGACVFDLSGRIGGMITTGLKAKDNPAGMDVTYATPIEWLVEYIKHHGVDVSVPDAVVDNACYQKGRCQTLAKRGNGLGRHLLRSTFGRGWIGTWTTDELPEIHASGIRLYRDTSTFSWYIN